MRRGAGILVVALLVASCGGADTGDTTTTTEPLPTTTAAAATTTVPTTSAPPSTSTTSTTTTAAPLDPGTYLVTSGICMLGWWDASWQSGDSPPVRGGETYQVVRTDEPITSAVGSAPGPHCDPLDLANVTLDPEPPGDFFGLDPIAIQTGSAVRPHLVELTPLDQAAYVDATRALLESRGLVDPPINLEQVIRTDLEGDGVNEVIVAASTIDPENALDMAVGDYSIVYLRKVIEGEVQTAILGDVIIDDVTDIPQAMVRLRVSAVADLNGDGKMEIVLSSEAWEGASLEVWEYVNDDLGPVQVQSCGCGV